jgi:pilus assembly protein Flp/PilA
MRKYLPTKVIGDKKGATAIEYGLIAALVAVAIVGGLQLLGPALNKAFATVATDVKTATG